MLILLLIALSGVLDPDQLLSTLAEYLEFIVPGQAAALVLELRVFLTHREAIGGVLLVTMLFFSTLAFTVLESALSVIFYHRIATTRRHFVVSALMPYVFIVFLALGLLLVTVVSAKLAVLATRDIVVFGDPTSLDGLSGYLLYLMGVAGEILLLTAIYLVMPVGRLSFRQALIGGASAGILWEMSRHVLVWYYGTLSQVQLVYGSLATAVTVMLSVEVAALSTADGRLLGKVALRMATQRSCMPYRRRSLSASSGVLGSGNRGGIGTLQRSRAGACIAFAGRLSNSSIIATSWSNRRPAGESGSHRNSSSNSRNAA